MGRREQARQPEPSRRSRSGTPNPLFRSTFAREAWRPDFERAGLDGFTFHGLRHSFAGHPGGRWLQRAEVSEWAGHNSVAFALTRYGGLIEDGSNQAVDRSMP